MSLHKKMVETVSAKILFGRDFSSEIFWSGFVFEHFFGKDVCLFKKNVVEKCLFIKKWWRPSLQRFCLVEISLLRFVGRDLSSNIFLVRMCVSSKKMW